MSANPAEIRPAQAAPLQANQAVIVGRIDLVRSYESKTDGRMWEHRVLQAAPDSFSSPGAVLVVGRTKLGLVGDDCKVRVLVTGYRDSYQKEGETYQTARVQLRAID